jgi:hypothetical protein
MVRCSALLQGIFCSAQAQFRQRRGIRRAPAYVASNKAWFQGIRTAIQSQATACGLYDLWQADIGDMRDGAWLYAGQRHALG